MLALVNTSTGTSITTLEILPIQHQKMFLLEFQTQGSGVINLKILNAQEQIIFSEEIASEKSFEKKFNLSELKSGKYALYIEDEYKITTQPLEVSSTGIEMNTQIRKVINKPSVYLNTKHRHLDINWTMNQKGGFSMSLSGKSSTPFFENKLENQKDIHRRYDLSGLIPGEYHLTIKNEDYTYHRTIRVQ